MCPPKIPEPRQPGAVRRLGSDRAGGQTALGAVVDALQMTHRAEPDEDVEGAVVLLKVRDADGIVSLRAVWSSEVSWLERIGMLREAEMVEARRHLDHAQSS